jgi:predicted Zn-dependent protease with MMP-like domain/thioredoxin-like negative regulator of GroEL
MSDQIELQIDAAWAAMDDGDVEEAQRLFDALRESAWDHPAVVMLGGELAAEREASEEAIELFLKAADMDPSWPDPLLAAADEVLTALGDPDRALELAERVIEGPEYPESARVEAMLLSAAALLEGGDMEAASERLDEIEELDPEDPDQRHALAELWLELDPERAEAVYRDLLDEDGEDLDALWGVGMSLQLQDRDPSEPWLEVRARELAAPPPALALTPEELEHIAEETLQELPESVRARLRDVPILIDDVPSEELVKDGVDPRLLGLFTGTPLPEKSALDGQSTSPDAAYLFLRNLAGACQSREELAEQVRITILHETAHFFGLEDHELERIGLG